MTDSNTAMNENTAEQSSAGESTETLVVVSRVKALISSKSGLNTSKCCVEALTKKIASECMAAIDRAKTAGRKTVMGRDIL